MNKPKINKRTLTVGTFALRNQFFKYSFFPDLRLRGKWLQNLGFTPGQQYEVQTVGNSILLTPLKSNK